MFRKRYCIANWKMNFSKSDINNFFNIWNNKEINKKNVNTIFCPSYIDINTTSELLLTLNSELGAQNIYFESKGAFTGEISCEMLKEYGCNWVIIGHSERRIIFGETNKIIGRKLDKLLNENMNPILCIGETEKERVEGKTKDILLQQLSVIFSIVDKKNIHNLVIAYEPVWAIGTGLIASINTIYETHKYIRSIVKKNISKGQNISILYGGSVTSENAKQLSMNNQIDGFLVGGASLDADSFYNIYKEL